MINEPNIGTNQFDFFESPQFSFALQKLPKSNTSTDFHYVFPVLFNWPFVLLHFVNTQALGLLSFQPAFSPFIVSMWFIYDRLNWNTIRFVNKIQYIFKLMMIFIHTFERNIIIILRNASTDDRFDSVDNIFVFVDIN